MTPLFTYVPLPLTLSTIINNFDTWRLGNRDLQHFLVFLRVHRSVTHRGVTELEDDVTTVMGFLKTTPQLILGGQVDVCLTFFDVTSENLKRIELSV